MNIGIDIDDTIPSAYVALTRLEEDIYTIYINSNDSIYADEMLIDELVFAEIAHIVNDIHQDLYVYSRSELQNFIKDYSCDKTRTPDNKYFQNMRKRLSFVCATVG